MKKMIAALFVGLSLLSCAKEEAKLSGEVANLNNGIAYFTTYQGENGYRFDKLVGIKDGKFTWKKEVLEPVLHEFKIDSTERWGVPFFMEAGEAHLSGSLDSLRWMRRGGTPNNIKLQEWMDMDNAFNKELNTIKGRYIVDYQANINTEKGQAILTQMRDELDKSRLAFEEKTFNWIKTNRESVAPLFVIEKYLKHNRDKVMLTDLYNQMGAGVKRTAYGRSLGELIQKANTIGKGDFAPNFSGVTPEGKTVSLFENLGQPLTLIDFWASWCGPCRKANPGLVSLYKDYQASGLQIIGYSLDRPGDENKWTEAIAMDQLTWLQLSNLKEFDDPVVKSYQIDAIPTTILIDERGQIVARNLFGNDLREFVKTYFAERAIKNQILTK